MLEVLGDDYIAQHISQEYIKERKEQAWRDYFGNALYAISNGLQMVNKWTDISSSKPERKPIDHQKAVDSFLSKFSSDGGNVNGLT